MMRHVLAAAALLLSGHVGVVVGQPSYDGECPGGALALTPDLYAKGYDAYKYAVCIPNGAFCNFDLGDYCAGSPGLTFAGNNVTLENLEYLVSVGTSAFLDFKGTLTFRGAFPRLGWIGSYGFWSAGDFASVVELEGRAVGALEQIGADAFQDFSGKVAITGAFPSFTAIEYGAFYGAINNNNVFAIQCRGGTWEVGTDAFTSMGGFHNATGEKCPCSDPCNPHPHPPITPAPKTECNALCIPKGVKRKAGQPSCCSEGKVSFKCPGPCEKPPLATKNLLEDTDG